jgi:hypothetical protein
VGPWDGDRVLILPLLVTLAKAEIQRLRFWTLLFLVIPAKAPIRFG